MSTDYKKLADELRTFPAEMQMTVYADAVDALLAERDRLAALVQKATNILESAVTCEECSSANAIDLALAVLKEKP